MVATAAGSARRVPGARRPCAALLVLSIGSAACSRQQPGAGSPQAASAAAQAPTSGHDAATPPAAAEPVAAARAAPSAEPPPPHSLEHCLADPYVPALERMPSVAGLSRAACGAGPAQQLLYTPGAGAPSSAELQALASRLQASLGPELTTHGVGVGSCCPAATPRDSPRELCISLRLPLCAQPLERTAAAIAEQLRKEPAWQRRLGVSLEYVGRTRPRCRPSEAGCGPLPYWDPNLSREAKAAGRVTPPYVADLPRCPVDVSAKGLALGQCQHDGDCIELGCGNHCAAWYVRPFGASCPAFDMLSDAHCGCVSRRCAWFTQLPEARFAISIGSPESDAPGPAARVQRSLPLGWLKRQFRSCYAGELGRLPLDVVAHFQVDARGRVRSPVVDSPDPPRAKCLGRALQQLTLPKLDVPPGETLSITLPMQLRLTEPATPPAPPP